MKERPIIMSAPMVRAILAGRKSMTRRVVKPQPTSDDIDNVGDCETIIDMATGSYIRCPYGHPGDRLWVRETWAWLEWCHQGSYAFTPPEEPTYPPHYVAADGGRRAVVHRAGTEKNAWGMKGEPKWRSAIHMPRTASRITLEVTDVRVERVQEIGGEDARAEGIRLDRCGCEICARSSQLCPADASSHVEEFAHLWESIHGAGSWAADPWVWVLTFRRLEEEATTGEARA